MARYGKTVGIVEKLVDRACDLVCEHAFSLGVQSHKRNGREVYRVEVTHGMARLYHYGTLTVMLNTDDGFVERYYGESASDRDSMNTFLDCWDSCPRNVFFRLSGGSIIMEGSQSRRTAVQSLAIHA